MKYVTTNHLRLWFFIANLQYAKSYLYEKNSLTIILYYFMLLLAGTKEKK